jgi:hypothetical protein
MSQWRWSMVRSDGCPARSCTTKVTSRTCRNIKRRMRRGRHSSSPKRDLGGSTTPMSGGSGEEGGGPAGPRATPGHGGAWCPMQGGREAVRWVGDGPRWRSEAEDRRRLAYQWITAAVTGWTGCRGSPFIDACTRWVKRAGRGNEERTGAIVYTRLVYRRAGACSGSDQR